MSEQPTGPQVPDDDPAASHASTGREVERPGGGRTKGETSVDEAMGTGDDPAR